MYIQMFLIPVLLPTLVVKSFCQNNTDPDIIVRYAGHAEANYPGNRIPSTINYILTENITPNVVYITPSPQTTTTEFVIPEETESVVFVPNDAPILRLEDNFDKLPLKLEDVLLKKTMGDMLKKDIRVETEAPHDIIFLASKNKDDIEKNTNEKKQIIGENGRRSGNRREMEEEIEPSIKLDCTNLDCNNSIDSICGRKMINRDIRYRLFLNECYFRKVNCNFKYEMNRYSLVSLEKCKNVGAHNSVKPFIFRPNRVEETTTTEESIETRRSFSSRRSMTIDMTGRYCSHSCPITCPDDYEPECALSATGHKKVFMNHCKLDDNSCLFGVVWHRRPLSDCVGGKKADTRHNRYFIDWLRRIGVVDNKGRLIMDT